MTSSDQSRKRSPHVVERVVAKVDGQEFRYAKATLHPHWVCFEDEHAKNPADREVWVRAERVDEVKANALE